MKIYKKRNSVPSFMIKVLIVVMLMLALVPNVFAGLLPRESYCYRQGYQFDYTIEPYGEWCIFNDGTRCDALDFYEGRCGEKYIRELPCKKQGEQIKTAFEECCKGLEPLSSLGGPYECVPEMNIFKKIWIKFILPFFLYFREIRIG